MMLSSPCCSRTVLSADNVKSFAAASAVLRAAHVPSMLSADNMLSRASSAKRKASGWAEGALGKEWRAWH